MNPAAIDEEEEAQLGREIGNSFADRMQHLDVTRCAKCFKKIKDDNGELLNKDELHRCVNAAQKLGEQLYSITSQTAESANKDYVLWCMLTTYKACMSNHLTRRRTRRSSTKNARSKDLTPALSKEAESILEG